MFRFLSACSMHTGNLIALAIACVASPVLAEDVLYCTDTAVVGFKWDKDGQASMTRFVDHRFTIKIIPAKPKNGQPFEDGIHFRLFTEKRIVSGGELTSTMEMECQPSLGATVVCEEDGSLPWAFSKKNTYTRAFLGGPPAGGGDPDILIAYGTCTKF